MQGQLALLQVWLGAELQHQLQVMVVVVFVQHLASDSQSVGNADLLDRLGGIAGLQD